MRFSNARAAHAYARTAGLAIALGTVSLLAGCASPTLVALDETWFACTRSRQCEILEDSTCALTPINKRYAAPFAQHMRVAHPGDVVTGPCAKPLVRYRAVCDEGRCSSELRGLVRQRGERRAVRAARGG